MWFAWAMGFGEKYHKDEISFGYITSGIPGVHTITGDVHLGHLGKVVSARFLHYKMIILLFP
jgi:hypothetical protein